MLLDFEKQFLEFRPLKTFVLQNRCSAKTSRQQDYSTFTNSMVTDFWWSQTQRSVIGNQ